MRDKSLGIAQSKSPVQQENKEPNHDGSYLDMSYSLSPSIVMSKKRNNSDARDMNLRESYNYDAKLLKSIEQKTMVPLVENYT